MRLVRDAGLGLALAGLAACKASLVDTRQALKGPVPEVPYIDFGGGEVRYPLGGAKSLRGFRRRDALAKMGRFCGGAAHVKVEREFDRDDMETPYHAGELEEVVALQAEHYRVHPYRHIVFGCTKPAPEPKKPVKKRASAPKPGTSVVVSSGPSVQVSSPSVPVSPGPP